MMFWRGSNSILRWWGLCFELKLKSSLYRYINTFNYAFITAAGIALLDT